MSVFTGRGMMGRHSRHEQDVSGITGYGAIAADRALFGEEDAEPLLFDASPSQVINLPNVLYGLIVLACVGAIDWFASNYMVVEPYVMLAQVAAVVGAVGLSFARTYRTRISIDAHRINWEQGVFKRVLFSTELAAVRDVAVVQPWWQRPFGVGVVMLGIDDPRKPARRLPGIRGFASLAELIREAAARAARNNKA
jgi:hypothetical protein